MESAIRQVREAYRGVFQRRGMEVEEPPLRISNMRPGRAVSISIRKDTGMMEDVSFTGSRTPGLVTEEMEMEVESLSGDWRAVVRLDTFDPSCGLKPGVIVNLPTSFMGTEKIDFGGGVRGFVVSVETCMPGF